MSDVKASFYHLNPSEVLHAVEDALGGERTGYRATGFILPLNSIENRVYEIRFEEAAPLIVKFYRPGRWSAQQILEEHAFLKVLADQELPVAPPVVLESPMRTLAESPSGIFFAAYPKMPGRLMGELSAQQSQRLALYLARIHSSGQQLGLCHRRRLDVETYFTDSLRFLQNSPLMDPVIWPHFEDMVSRLALLAAPKLEGVAYQRVHGDCHVGNVLWEQEERPFIVDFDDMMDAPVVQDFWMLFGGREEEDRQRREDFLESYERVLPFDRTQLGLMEVCRAMRIVYYSAWIARRWDDPSFPKTFPHFGTLAYWREELDSLGQVLSLLENSYGGFYES